MTVRTLPARRYRTLDGEFAGTWVPLEVTNENGWVEIVGLPDDLSGLVEVPEPPKNAATQRWVAGAWREDATKAAAALDDLADRAVGDSAPAELRTLIAALQDIENRLRALEGRQGMSPVQYKDAMKLAVKGYL
jgi:hypothetical protein